jgi:HSP20 family molecular chaperone IbpA
MKMEWAPAIDVFEREAKFIVKAELPGMNEQDTDILINKEGPCLKE